MTPETVSRSVTRLRTLSLIETHVKETRITDFDGLREIAAVSSGKHALARHGAMQKSRCHRRSSGMMHGEEVTFCGLMPFGHRAARTRVVLRLTH
ncbi:hypothetical protein ACLKMY_12865 [Paraburkholderia mimosarum]|uniref:hypothetical protein n=1 Tax=Paraburkholderia mimosarum TaxID=312026 RepID=UPI0039C420BE